MATCSFSLEMITELLDPEYDSINPSKQFMLTNTEASVFRGMFWPVYTIVLSYKILIKQDYVPIGKKLRGKNNE
jgi:hypothetical protein